MFNNHVVLNYVPNRLNIKFTIINFGIDLTQIEYQFEIEDGIFFSKDINDSECLIMFGSPIIVVD